jgi:hypothetical protein
MIALLRSLKGYVLAVSVDDSFYTQSSHGDGEENVDGWRLRTGATVM